jgi:hypothetical protein
MSKPTQDQQDLAVNTAYEIKDTIGTRWRGMTYEDGVIAALEWVRGDRDEDPFEEN